MKITLCLAALAALSLAACGKSDAPAGSEVAASMPDTSAQPTTDVMQTAPDAGATGQVPPEGQLPPAAPAATGAGRGSPGVATVPQGSAETK